MASTRIEDVKSVSHLALAEACATALSHAAEAVSSGDLDAGKSIKSVSYALGLFIRCGVP